MRRKVLLLGRAGIGKSSIKKVIFEGIQPQVLLEIPFEPTRGLSPETYTWLDLYWKINQNFLPEMLISNYCF